MTSVATSGSRYDYTLPAPIFYGKGSAARLSEYLDELGLERPHVVTTRSLLESDTLQSVASRTPRHGSATSVISAHVPLADVARAAAQIAAAGSDVVLAIGGGSAIDAAKLASLAAADPHIGSASEVQVKALLAAPPVGAVRPVLCFPTTLGGAELGSGGGFTDTTSGNKEGAYQPAMLPRAVFYDPALASDTPRDLWLTTGVRALDHAFETLAHPAADPLAVDLAVAGIADLFEALPIFAADRTDVDNVVRCQVAAWKSYTAPSLAAAGLSHQLGRAVGASNGIPHGVTSCVILPQVVRHYESQPELRPRLAGVRRALGLRDPVGDHPLADALEHLVHRLGLPTRFTRAELDDAGLRDAAARAAGPAGVPVELAADLLESCREQR